MSLKLVCCHPEDADALTRSPLIKHITFIGSEHVGRKIAIAATEHLTPVTLELSGKDPAVILSNTELEKWISMWMRGILQVPRRSLSETCLLMNPLARMRVKIALESSDSSFIAVNMTPYSLFTHAFVTADLEKIRSFAICSQLPPSFSSLHATGQAPGRPCLQAGK
ncbi:Meiotic Sister-Chromatid recombination aldehyde dehydrogenase [Marasmius sp. AFHP31]|nr:Meiotic Sister-Chromatid recombination aldehyde dehydrogenase [Marasmius sp. AFHP31]